jgi:hypothetical protein
MTEVLTPAQVARAGLIQSEGPQRVHRREQPVELSAWLSLVNLPKAPEAAKRPRTPAVGALESSALAKPRPATLPSA